ncbi:hypothetical protein KKD57_00760 [Patescibacteria group bacterium]|nr:hypothetical protein [Patescibacteria group bacterium]
MKTIYVNDLLLENQTEKDIVLSGWLSSRRHIGKVIFLDISDSTYGKGLKSQPAHRENTMWTS